MIRLFLRLLDRLDRLLHAAEVTLVCLSLSLMLGVSFVQVILRNVFDGGIAWAEIFVRHLVLFVLFFGASLSTRTRRHIQMDISSQIIPHSFKPLLGLFINAFCVLVNAYLFKAALTFMNMERELQSELFHSVKSWHVILVMPVGFGLITIRFALNWINDVLVLLKLKKPEADTHGLHAPIVQEGSAS